MKYLRHCQNMEFLCKGRGLNEGRIKEFYTDLAVPSDFSHWAQGISRRFDRLALSKDSYIGRSSCGENKDAI